MTNLIVSSHFYPLWRYKRENYEKNLYYMIKFRAQELMFTGPGSLLLQQQSHGRERVPSSLAGHTYQQQWSHPGYQAEEIFVNSECV